MANGRVGNRRAIINLAEQADAHFSAFAKRILMLEARVAELELPWWKRLASKLRRRRALALRVKQTEGGA